MKRMGYGLFVLSLGCLLARTGAGEEVRIWEEALTLPTYEVGPADVNPRFFDGRGYQGAKGPVYPYPMLDTLTQQKADRTYQALYLENEYVRFCVLPEIGGRIFEAYDKTNDHHFFYRQHVVKPDLIGMLGAWISGGVEWCVFHHHRNTTFMPVDYLLAENEDGSKTIWIGETERRHRMKWIIGMTLHPGESRLDVMVKLFNGTPYVNSILYWANVAIHSTPGYQVIFPPSTQFGTFHGKGEFSHWPISHEKFNGMDYTQGVDVSWWKNHPNPSSFFAWNVREDFFAGYDHDKHAGVVHVADHHVVPGMKLWTWGTQSTADRTKLTDDDGPYAEIMVGAYSDNQPDYSWIQPHEVKAFTQSWYPLRGLDGLCNATRDAAVNLTVSPDGIARVAFNTSGKHSAARVSLRAGGTVLLEKTASIDPATPFAETVAVPQGVAPGELHAALYDGAGRELVAYQPQVYEPEPMPEPVTPPPAPAEFATVEELYLAGQRLQQFYNPTLEPYPYYEEALKRDPDDVRTNTALGIDDCRRGMFTRAEERLRRAVARLTKHHTRPRDGEPHYYLGVALVGQEKYDEAYDAYNHAAWNRAWHSPANYALAELDCLKGDFARALEHLDQALATDALDTRALGLRATVLRRLGRIEEALQQVDRILEIDPLDFRAGNERYLAECAKTRDQAARRALEALSEHMRDEVENYLELASGYAAGGLYDEAIDVLARRTTGELPETYPMLYYDLGYYTAQRGDSARAIEYYRAASRLPSAYCLPYRLESIRVLRHAIAACPDDARACYYLGNLLYDLQPEEAVLAWEQAKTLDNTLATAHRNLGYAYYKRQADYPKAIAEYEQSVACDNSDPRVFYELEQLYAESGAAPETRLALLCKNQATTDKRSDLLARQIRLFVETGQYDTALDMLANRRFDTWEGGTEIHDTYVEARVLRGMAALKAGQAREALGDFQAALDYPANLGVDRPPNDPPAARTHFLIAAAYETLGDAEKARAGLEESAKIDVGGSEFRYYKGQALARLGQAEAAKALFDALSADGAAQLEKGGPTDFFMKFGEKQAHGVQMAQAHYLAGLGALGNGDPAKAKEHFEAALKENPNHLWARIQRGDVP
jgi:tetratricopeptide (TPR) repeat protein